MIWPSLYVAHFYYASWAVLLGLAVECIVFRLWLKFSWKKAFLASVVVNALSAGLGGILIPLSGIVWELTGGLVLDLGNIGTFNPITWMVSWLLAAVVNAAVEFWPLIWPFRAKRSWRVFGIVLAANMVSVAFAFAASFFMAWPERP